MQFNNRFFVMKMSAISDLCYKIHRNLNLCDGNNIMNMNVNVLKILSMIYKLYLSLFTEHYTTGSEDPDYRRASDKLLYIPNLEEGLKTPSYEEGKKIVQDV